MIIIRLATHADIGGLAALKARLQLGASGNESDGFLLASDESSIRRLLQHALVLLAVASDEVVGYISGYPRSSSLFRDLLDTPGVFSWEKEDPLSRTDLFYVDALGVVPEWRSSGTALALFRTLRDHSDSNSFLTAVVEKPVTNHRSARVISGFGFRRIGQFNAAECFGWKDYQSGLYLRGG